jgi:hypothetical protein
MLIKVPIPLTVCVLVLLLSTINLPAHTNCAVSVVSYLPGTGTVTGIEYDRTTDFPYMYYTNASAALGRPTVDSTGDDWDIDLTNVVPVCCVYPPFRWFEVVSIGFGGHLELAFEQPVVDDPRNPWGIDLLIYGNSRMTMPGYQSWTNGNPSNTTVMLPVYEEPGEVWVSQDGAEWFAVSNVFADTFPPTLGRMYDPENAENELGPWNHWWANATDPTFPPDPAFAASNATGLTVAEMARAYGHSAGGTGIDISSLDLPVDPGSGFKWIQYIKIVNTNSSGATPEIDAVVDVNPVSEQAQWQLAHFSWQQRMDSAIAGMDADPDGDFMENALEYYRGSDPLVANASGPWQQVTFSEQDGTVFSAAYRHDVSVTDCTAVVAFSSDLQAWSTQFVNQAEQKQPLGTSNELIYVATTNAHNTGSFRLQIEDITF